VRSPIPLIIATALTTLWLSVIIIVAMVIDRVGYEYLRTPRLIGTDKVPKVR